MGLANAPTLTSPMRENFDDANAPSTKDLTLIGLAALAVGVAGTFIVMKLRHATAWDVAHLGDGKSYISYARYILGRPSELVEFDLRVFPGTPLLIAGIHVLGLPVAWAAILLSWICGAAVAPLSALLFRDRRMGMAMAFLTPEFMAQKMIVSSEATVLAFTVLGLVLATRNRSVLAGLAFGVAGICRPMACFAVIGYILYAARRRAWAQALIVGAISGVIVVATLLALRHFQGDALKGVRVYANSPDAYDGELFAWPMKSLLLTPFRSHQPIPKIVVSWTYAILVVAGSGLLIARYRRASHQEMRDVISMPWLVGNTFFVLCIGSFWGFAAFGRFLSPALPALAWGYRRWLPRSWVVWWIIGIPSMLVGIYYIQRH